MSSGMVVYAKLFGSNTRVGRLPVICQKYQNNVRVPNDPSPIAYGEMLVVTEAFNF